LTQHNNEFDISDVGSEFVPISDSEIVLVKHDTSVLQCTEADCPEREFDPYKYF
jgi:hypothetical protein